MNLIKSPIGRAINYIVLITYLTSILNIGYLGAAEPTSEKTVTIPPVTRILRLRGDVFNVPEDSEALPKQNFYDYKVSIKRKAIPLNQGGLAESGYMVKLKTPKTNVASQNGVMYQFFMADNVPFSDSFMQSIGLEPCLDDQLGMIGLNWRLKNLPNLNFLILRDGTLFVNGEESSQKTIRISSSGLIHLQNLRLASTSLKARKVHMDDGVDIKKSSISLINSDSIVEVSKNATVNLPDLKLLRGRFLNNGRFVTNESQYFDLAAGTIFENNGFYQTSIATTFSGTGSFLNRGTFNSLMLHGQLNELRNYSTIESTEIDLTIRGVIYNTGLILGLDRTFLISLTNQIENTGRIVGQNSYKMVAQGQIQNSGDITGENGVVSSIEGRLENGGRISGAKIQSKSFRNGYKGVVINSSITTDDGENLGDLDLQELTVNQGTFTNKGRSTVNSLLGSGTLKNHANFSLRGTAIKRAVLGIRSFYNQTTLDDAAIFEGSFVTLAKNVRRFILDQGLTNIADLMFETSLAASIYRNTGILSIGFLTLNQQTFDNFGSMTIAHQLTGLGTILNNKKLVVQGINSFPQGSIINTDTLALAGSGVLGTIDNQNILEVDPGTYTISTLKNHGTTSLFGDSWTVSDRAAEQEGNHLHIQTLENPGTIGGEHQLVYDRAEPRTGIWEAETFVYRQAGKNLTPQDLINLVADHVEVEALSFEVPEVSTISIPHLILRLTGNFNIDQDLTTRALEAYPRLGFRCGSNTNMAKLRAYGTLKVHSIGAINLRSAKVFATGDTSIRVVGQNSLSVGGHHITYEKKTDTGSVCESQRPARIYGQDNGAYIVTLASLDLGSRLTLFVEGGQIISLGDMLLDAPTTYNHSAKIKSARNIISKGNYVNEFCSKSIGKSNNIITMHQFAGNSALLQAGENINFEGDNVNNFGGHILAGDSIYYQGRVVANKKMPFDGSFSSEVAVEFWTDRWNNRYEIRKVPALVQAGQNITIDIGDIQLTGTTSAFRVSMNSNTFAARNVGRHTQRPQYDTHLLVDLTEFAHGVYGPDGFIRTTPDGRIITDIPISGGFTPTIPQRLFIDSQESSTMASTSSGIPAFLTDPSLQFSIDSMPLPFILQQALAQFAGTLNIDGRSGDPLIQYLLNNAQELKDQHGSAMITRQDLRKARKSLLAYDIDQNSTNPIAKPFLVLTPQTISPYQSSGDISGETINIHTSATQDYDGSTVHANQTTALTSDHHITAISSSITGDQKCKLEAETISLSRDVERLYTQYGYVDRVCAPMEVGSSQGDLEITTRGDLGVAGIYGFGRDGIRFIVDGNYIDDTVVTYRDETQRHSKKLTTHDSHAINHRSHYATGGFVDPSIASSSQSHMTVTVGGNTFVRGSVSNIDGNHTRTTQGSTTLAAAIDQHEHSEIRKKRKGGLRRVTGGKKRIETTRQNFTVERLKIKANADILEKAKKNLTLQAAHLQAGGKITLESEEGRIALLTAAGINFESVKKSSGDVLWDSSSQYAALDEEIHLCYFQSGLGEEGIHFKTPEGITVELVVKKTKTTDASGKKPKIHETSQVKDLSGIPGLEWLKLLDNRDDVLRVYVDERHEITTAKHQGMTAAAKIIASIILTCITGGAGGMFSGLAQSTAAAIGGVTGAIVGTAVNTTLTVLCRTMMLNTVEQRGNIGAAGQTTFNKQTLKGLGAKLIGQILIGGGQSPASEASQAAQTATEQIQEATTSWGTDLQDAFADSLRSNMESLVGQGIVYGNWQDQLKQAGAGILTDTVAQFGAQQIGGKRREEIQQDLEANSTDIPNYLSHKLSHAVLAAATQSSQTAMVGGNRKEIKKAAKGGAVGAAAAEVVAEFMMPKMVVQIQQQLEQSGFIRGTAAYQYQYKTMMRQELEALQAQGQIAAVVCAQAIGGDLCAAQSAACNAIQHNSAQVLEMLAQYGTSVFNDQLERNIDDEEINADGGDTDDEAEQTGYMQGRKKVIEATSSIVPEGISRLAQNTAQNFNSYEDALDQGPDAWAEERLRQMTQGCELSPAAREILLESYREQHAELASAHGIAQGIGMLTDGIGLGLEYGLRYSGLVDRGTARAVHHGFNDLGMLVGGSSIAKTIIKKASRGFKLRATPSGLGTQPQPRYLDDHIDLTTQNRGVSSPTGATNRNTQSIGLLYLKQRREAVNRNLLRMQRTGTGTAEAIPDSMVASSSNGVISAQRVTSSSSVSNCTSMAKPGNVADTQSRASSSNGAMSSSTGIQPHSQELYNPHAWRQYFETTYGSGNVSSSTLQRLGTRGYKMAGQQHSSSKVVYDSRGNPDFTPHMTYETFVSPEQFYQKKPSSHMRAATRNLRSDIEAGKVDISKFSREQQDAIKSGKAQIPGFTWHHDQQARRMQLIDSEKHAITHHTGSVASLAKD